MRMRPLKTLALAFALAAGHAAVAQDIAIGWNPRSGDVWVDAWLGDINEYGNRYREPFIDEIVRYHGAPRDLVVDLLVDRGWAPGDVYYACALASVLGRPCRYVAVAWERDHAQGWGAVAKNLGIKPGSAEFHRLKRGFVPTYDRWARPIELDDELRRAFPDRGKGAKAAHGNDNGKGKAARGGNGNEQGASKADRGAPKGNGKAKAKD